MGWSIPGGESVGFASGAATVRGHLGRPAAPGRHPAIVLIHGIYGLAAGNKAACERLGAEGYVALGIDWKSHEPEPSNEAILGYVEAAAAWLRNQEYVDPERIAVGGYCKGGMLTYVALGTLGWPWAGVVYHGTLRGEDGPPRPVLDALAGIQAPLIALHGASDPVSPLANTMTVLGELDRQGKPFQLKVYGGARHAFTLPDGGDYDAAVAADAWEETIRFLNALPRR